MGNGTVQADWSDKLADVAYDGTEQYIQMKGLAVRKQLAYNDGTNLSNPEMVVGVDVQFIIPANLPVGETILKQVPITRTVPGTWDQVANASVPPVMNAWTGEVYLEVLGDGTMTISTGQAGILDFATLGVDEGINDFDLVLTVSTTPSFTGITPAHYSCRGTAPPVV